MGNSESQSVEISQEYSEILSMSETDYDLFLYRLYVLITQDDSSRLRINYMALQKTNPNISIVQSIQSKFDINDNSYVQDIKNYLNGLMNVRPCTMLDKLTDELNVSNDN